MRDSGSITDHIWQEEGVRDMHIENGGQVGGAVSEANHRGQEGLGREMHTENRGERRAEATS